MDPDQAASFILQDGRMEEQQQEPEFEEVMQFTDKGDFDLCGEPLSAEIIRKVNELSLGAENKKIKKPEQIEAAGTDRDLRREPLSAKLIQQLNELSLRVKKKKIRKPVRNIPVQSERKRNALKIDLNDVQPVPNCAKCLELNADKPRLVVHKHNDHNVMDRRECPLCFESFSCQDSVLRHVRKGVCQKQPEFFNQNEPLPCDRCCQRFHAPADLLAHRESIHCISKLECPWCSRSFNRCQYTVLHMRTVHVKEYRYNCEYCTKHFFYQRDVPKHMRNVHPEVFQMRTKYLYNKL